MYHFKTKFKPDTTFTPRQSSSKDCLKRILPNLEFTHCHEQTMVPLASPNCFVGTATMAFDAHLGLILNPDDVWITILQGLSRHVQMNAEKCRYFFVNHEGQETLDVWTDVPIDWLRVFDHFQSQIREKANHIDHLVADFTTSTPLSRTVTSMTIMDCLQSYFRYNVMTSCGIPSYTLEGEVEDWHKIYGRSQFFLQELGLSAEWGSKLFPVLEEFVRAAEGNPDPSFWDSFVKKNSMSGGSHVSGHILGLIPFVRNRRGEFSLLRGSACEEMDIPCSLSQTPFTLDGMDQYFVGGFSGAAFTEGTIRPAMTWAIAK